MLAGMALAAAGLAAAPSPAMAAGGGCTDYIRSGWNVGVCSSDNGNTVFGDVYVNARGPLGSVCNVLYRIIYLDNSGNWRNTSPKRDGCHLGRHSAISLPASYGTIFETHFDVVVNNRSVHSGSSPQTRA